MVNIALIYGNYPIIYGKYPMVQIPIKNPLNIPRFFLLPFAKLGPRAGKNFSLHKGQGTARDSGPGMARMATFGWQE